MIEINTIFVKEIGMETPQIFDPRTVINSTATVCSDLKTYSEKCMFDAFVYCCCLEYVASEDNVDIMSAVT